MLNSYRLLINDIYAYARKSPQHAYWRLVEKTQWFSENRLREIQARRLKELLSFAYLHNTFYQERFDRAGVRPEDIKAPNDISKLPILTKQQVRSFTPLMISRGFGTENLQRAKTGGSTGRALELFYTENCSELRNAVARRHDRWTGWEPGQPIAVCWGNPSLPQNTKERVKNRFIQPIFYLDTMNVNEESIRAFARQWRQIRPTLLYGHAHSLFLLTTYLKEFGIYDLHPKGILSTSMMLAPHERKVIEAFFGLKIIDRYGCEEVSLIGCECEKHEGMHLNIEHLLIEFIKDDGMPSAPGEPGRIVVTDLMNRAMPLIRYQVEDIGVPSDKKCSCGRGLPLMAQVQGRMADFLVKKDGTKVAGISLIENTLTRFTGLDQMQFIQLDINRFEVRIVPGNTFKKSIIGQLELYLKRIFGKNADISFSLLDEIPLEQSGKYRFSICNIKSDG